MMPRSSAPILMALAVMACGDPAEQVVPHAPAPAGGPVVVVRDSIVPDEYGAAATVEPFARADLGTRLMGRVTAVAAREGDMVAAGALLVELDDADLRARRDQADANLRSAEAAQREATLHAGRLRSLFADSAAPRAQLDAAEAGQERADQAVRAARAGIAEVESMATYAQVRAPFAGQVTRRAVDPGAFATPGAPLVTIEDATRLRLVAAVPPAIARHVRRGQSLSVTVEGAATTGTVDAVVPAAGASLTDVQVIVDNRDRRFSSGSAATILLPGASRRVVLVPASAVVTEGDLVGVRVPTAEGPATRWLRLGRTHGTLVEVLSGLVAGDSVIVPVDVREGA